MQPHQPSSEPPERNTTPPDYYGSASGQPPTSPPPEAEPHQHSVEIVFPRVEPYVTYGILGVLIVIHLYVMSLNQLELFNFYGQYANIANQVTNGEYYRLFSSMFLHADLMHLLFNCMFIFIFGREIEALFGHVRFAMIYFLGGLTGSVASYVITQSSSIGASGAAFAIFGAAVAYFYKHRKLYGDAADRQLRQLGTLAAVNLFIGFVSNVPGSPVRIDNAAHIGGALGGLLLAWFLTPEFQIRTRIEGSSLMPQLVDTKSLKQWAAIPILFSGAMLMIIVLVINARTVG